MPTLRGFELCRKQRSLVVARLVALPEHQEKLRAILTNLVEPTRQENGGILYQLLQNQDGVDDIGGSRRVREAIAKVVCQYLLKAQPLEAVNSAVGRLYI